MLSIKKVKELANDPTLSDEQAQKIRDGFYSLVGGIIFPQWIEYRKKNKKDGVPTPLE